MNLKKLLAFSISLIAITISVLGQENTTTTTSVTTTTSTPFQRKFARPNIPGTFVLEVGLNMAANVPDRFSLYFWGARTLNIYYQYDARILNSKFSFHPGIGFGMDRYRFKNGYFLSYDDNSTGSLSMINSNGAVKNVRKSQLIANYLDIPMELRFSTNPDDPARSFKISVGGRAGLLLDSHTKLKYSDDNGNKIKIKDKQAFNLESFRYGIYAKIGGGNFSIMGYYNLSPLFKSGKGPTTGNAQPIDTNNFTIGISLSSF